MHPLPARCSPLARACFSRSLPRPHSPPQLSSLTVTSTLGITANGFTAGASATAGVTGSGDDAFLDAAGVTSITGVAAVTPTILDIDTSMLTVVIQPAVGGGVTQPPAVDLSVVKDVEPPVVTLKGPAYVQVLQATGYTDPGATAFDNIDGSAAVARSKLALCASPVGGVGNWTAVDARQLTCGTGVYAAVDTAAPGGGQVWVFTYTSRDAAGNSARPLRRLVEVMPRCVFIFLLRVLLSWLRLLLCWNMQLSMRLLEA